MPSLYPLLVADIGGTNCRVGVVEAPDHPPKRLEVVSTAQEASAALALGGVVERHALRPAGLALAIAGVVQGFRAEMTNSRWTFDLAEIAEALGIPRAVMVNDFAALAASLPSLAGSDLVRLQAGIPDSDGACLVVGPGTGFGAAALLPRDGGWVIMPSEAGHVALGPETDAEAAFWRFLPRDARITCETLLCGNGLVLIAAAQAKQGGRANPYASPQRVTQAALAGDRQAVAAVTAFLDLFARVTGDLALAFKATGGVWLAGGVTHHLLPMLDRARFVDLFRTKPPMEPLLNQLPLACIAVPDAAERGLATIMANPARFGVGAWTR